MKDEPEQDENSLLKFKRERSDEYEETDEQDDDSDF